MEIAIGIVLAFAVGLLASLLRLDRERGFYPTIMVVIASYYALFAVIGNSPGALARECVPIALFVAAALAGFRHSLWLVVAALVAHGVFDLVHASVIANPGVPAWWPAFCLAYDVVAGGYLAWLLGTKRIAARGFRPGARANSA